MENCRLACLHRKSAFGLAVTLIFLAVTLIFDFWPQKCNQVIWCFHVSNVTRSCKSGEISRSGLWDVNKLSVYDHGLKHAFCLTDVLSHGQPQNRIPSVANIAGGCIKILFWKHWQSTTSASPPTARASHQIKCNILHSLEVTSIHLYIPPKIHQTVNCLALS